MIRLETSCVLFSFSLVVRRLGFLGVARFMEWSWYDPDRGEVTNWWTIDPQTGQPNGGVTGEPISCHCVGESALNEVSVSGDAIATTFATRLFSDDEVFALVMKRVVPSSFQGGEEDVAELLELVDGLWTLAGRCYQQALGRMPNEVERRWLYASALEALRARQNAG